MLRQYRTPGTDSRPSRTPVPGQNALLNRRVFSGEPQEDLEVAVRKAVNIAAGASKGAGRIAGATWINRNFVVKDLVIEERFSDRTTVLQGKARKRF